MNQADIVVLRALATHSDTPGKLVISHGFELINCGTSVYFHNIGRVQQLVVELMTKVGVRAV